MQDKELPRYNRIIDDDTVEKEDEKRKEVKDGTDHDSGAGDNS